MSSVYGGFAEARGRRGVRGVRLRAGREPVPEGLPVSGRRRPGALRRAVRAVLPAGIDLKFNKIEEIVKLFS